MARGSQTSRRSLGQAIEHVTDLIGDWGRWQSSLFYFYLTISVFQAFNNLGMPLMSAKTDFRCKLANYSFADTQFDRCFVDTNKTVPCTDWEFDTSQYAKTMQSEWNLVCGRSWLISATQAVYMVGMIVSSLVCGHLSDKYGRLPVLQASIVMEIASGILASLSPSVYVFMIGRFLLAIGAYGRYLTGFMLVMETTGPNVRATKGITCRLGWAIGYFLLPGLGMLFTNFRHLSLALSVPELLWLYWLNKVSESPRWLMATDKPDKAAHIITKAMRVNGKSMVGIEDKLRQLQSNFKKTDEPVVEANLKDLFLWPALRKNTLILMFTWFTTGFVYYGLSLNIGDLGGSLLVNFAIAGILEFPAFGLSVYALEHYGRRNVQALIMFGAALGSIAAIPLYAFDVAHVVRLTLGMFVKFCLACSWNVIYVYSAEVYPTVVRQIGVGSNSAASRIGSAMAPFMKEITQYTHISVTLAIFGVLCLVNAMTILILPETKDQEIPDSIQEAERKYGAK